MRQEAATPGANLLRMPEPRTRWVRALGATVVAVLVSGVVAVEVSAGPGGPTPTTTASGEATATSSDPSSSNTSDGVALRGEVVPDLTGERPTVSADVEVQSGIVDLEPAAQVGGATPSAAERCGELDHPETGVQGDVPLADQLSGRAAEGYTCGLSVIGANTLGGRGGNANMAWVDDCAYVTGAGVAVLDVSDPTAPQHVTTLHGPGSDNTIETIAAVDAPDRQLLAAGRYGFQFDFGLTGRAPVDIYDVSDCAHPRFLTTFEFPGAVHNLTFSADGRRLWSTIPLQAADTTDPAHPVYEGSLDDALRTNGPFHLEYAHEVTPSPDGTTIYVGGQIPGDEATMVFDVSNWPAEPPRLLSSFAGAGHSIRAATIGGRRYLLRSDESIVGPLSNGCLPEIVTPAGGPAEPRLTDITDLAHPVDVGTLNLEINQPEHCPEALASGVDASAHYHDVDDPDDTTFAMVSMWNAGLRLFDVRDPSSPTEVAYFNPGRYDLGVPANATDVIGFPSRGVDQTWGHVRYDAATGHIWVATRTGGFWVLELQPQLRSALGLPALPAIAPLGGPARPTAALASQVAPTALAGAGDALVYCTLTGRTPLLGAVLQ